MSTFDYGTIKSDQEALNALGVFCGTGDIYIAFLTKEDTRTMAPTYTAPIVAAEGVDVGLTPTYAEGKISGSNHQIRSTKRMTNMEVAIQYARMLAQVRGAVLGESVDKNGGHGAGKGMAPVVAVGVCATRDDGTAVMHWIYKCRASEGSVTMHTEEEGTINYQVPTINFNGSSTIYETQDLKGNPMTLVEYTADTADLACKWTRDTFFQEVRGPWSEQVLPAAEGQ